MTIYDFGKLRSKGVLYWQCKDSCSTNIYEEIL